jgi:hypothetical protein
MVIRDNVVQVVNVSNPIDPTQLASVIRISHIFPALAVPSVFRQSSLFKKSDHTRPIPIRVTILVVKIFRIPIHHGVLLSYPVLFSFAPIPASDLQVFNSSSRSFRQTLSIKENGRSRKGNKG